MAEEMQTNAMMKSELIERIARKQSHLAKSSRIQGCRTGG